MNLRCIKHPKYDGKTNPVLECRTCCNMFLLLIKENHKPVWTENRDRLSRVSKTISKVNLLMATLQGRNPP